MLTRADLGKQFYTIDKKGNHRILKLSENRWTGEPCFTDGEENFYLDGSGYGYEDDIVAYWPYEYEDKDCKNILKLVVVVVLAFWLGCMAGQAVKSAECEVLLNEANGIVEVGYE